VEAETKQFWRALESFPSGAGLLADWQAVFAAQTERVRAFLKPTVRLGRSYPCPFKPACGCRHEVRGTDAGLVGVCACGDCEPVDLEPAQLILHELDWERFGGALRGALELSEPDAQRAATKDSTHVVGIFAALHARVYVELSGAAKDYTDMVERLSAERQGSFVVMVPTGESLTRAARGAIARAGGLALALDEFVAVREGGRMTGRQSLAPVLARWAEELVRGDGNGELLRQVHHEIAAVRAAFAEERSARQRLEGMLGGGLFAFTRKIDAHSFRLFCAILAEGNIAKAARSLDIADSTLRDALRDWRSRGPAYLTLLDLVRWRKAVRVKGTVPFNENMLLEKSSSTDYPGLLSDVLDGLLEMTEDNWQERCEELAEMLRAQQ
jgi:hypothetical protein